MQYSNNPSARYNTAENLQARDRALQIWHSAPVEEIPLSKVVEMIYHAQESAIGSRAEGEFCAERMLLEEFRDRYEMQNLGELREAFRTRKFSESDVRRWVESEVDLLKLTDDALVEGYPEYLIGANLSDFRSPANTLEMFRRKFVDERFDFADFISFYSDAGKSQK